MSSYIWYTKNTSKPKLYMEVGDESKYNKFLRPENFTEGTKILVNATKHNINFACVVEESFDISDDYHGSLGKSYVTTIRNDDDE